MPGLHPAEHMERIGQSGRLIRARRTALRREVESAETWQNSRDALAAIAEDAPVALARMMVWEALGWLKRLDLTQRRAILRHAGIGEYRLFGELTDRQRRALCHALRSPAMARRAA